MRTTLRVGAALLAVVVFAIWFFGGMNRGWTKTYVERKVTDPVTELDGIVREKRFTAGLDFLGAGIACSAALAGFSFVFKAKPKPAVN